MPEITAKGVIKLTPKEKKTIEGYKEDIENTKIARDALKTLGMDTKDIDEKLAFAEAAREVLLKDFS